jgi:hypothetical protein
MIASDDHRARHNDFLGLQVSSDNMGPGRAVERRADYHAGGTFNSGMLLFRATRSGRAFVSAWHRNVAAPSRGSRFERLSSDQQVQRVPMLVYEYI